VGVLSFKDKKKPDKGSWTSQKSIIIYLNVKLDGIGENMFCILWGIIVLKMLLANATNKTN
jgi:hypothetical protein